MVLLDTLNRLTRASFVGIKTGDPRMIPYFADGGYILGLIGNPCDVCDASVPNLTPPIRSSLQSSLVSHYNESTDRTELSPTMTIKYN